MILAFDLATNVGVCVGEPDAAPSFFTERLDDTPHCHEGRFADALLMTKRYITEYSPDIIAIEKPIASGPVGNENRAFVLIGLRACVFGMAKIYKIPVVEFPVGKIRTHFLGAGNIKRAKAKLSTIQQCERLGWSVANDDEADAGAVFEMTRVHLGVSHMGAPGGLFGTARVKM